MHNDFSINSHLPLTVDTRTRFLDRISVGFVMYKVVVGQVSLQLL